MKKIFSIFALAFLLYLSFQFGRVYDDKELKFEFVENVDEMEPTPEEVYIGINGSLYAVDTETLETKLISKN